MLNFRTLDEVMEESFRVHPEDIDGFVSILFEEYAQDGDMATLLSGLRIVCRVKGVSLVTENSDLNRADVQKVISEDGDPTFASVCAIFHALGY